MCYESNFNLWGPIGSSVQTGGVYSLPHFVKSVSISRKITLQTVI